jgi:hypothetical protein
LVNFITVTIQFRRLPLRQKWVRREHGQFLEILHQAAGL